MGLLDIIRKPKASAAPSQAEPPLKPWMQNLLSTEEFITGCLLDEVPKEVMAPKDVMSQQKLDETLKGFNGLAVGAYRRIYSDGEVGASPEMPDALILDIYRRVGCAFRKVARERGEFIESAVINAIVGYFLETYRKLGSDFFEDHLRYEIEKYKREGLRADYSQHPLHLFRYEASNGA